MVKEKTSFVTYAELFEAYLDCRKRKRSSLNETIYEINAHQNLCKLYDALNNGTYKIGKSICFVVLKPVPREVFAADFVDRIIHHLLIKKIINILECYGFSKDSYSCRKGMGTDYGVVDCAEKIKFCSNFYHSDCYILKCDLKSFFMTINKNILYKKLGDLLKKHYAFKSSEEMSFWLNLCYLIIYNNPTLNCIMKGNLSNWDKIPPEKSLFNCSEYRGLPIGNLTSQMFANLYLSDFDKYITEELGFKCYGRYVDDFYIVSTSKEALLKAVPKIREKLKEFEVILHPKKLYLQHYSKGVNFIGHVIKLDRIYIGNRTKGNFYWKLKELGKLLDQDTITFNEMEHFVSVVNSYLGFMSHYKTYNIRTKALIKTKFIENFFNNYGITDISHCKVNLNIRSNVYYPGMRIYTKFIKIKNNKKENKFFFERTLA